MNTQTEIQTTQDTLQIALAAIRDDPTLQPSTKRQYTNAITNYVQDGHSLTDAQALTSYAATVGSSTRSFLKAAISKLCSAIEQQAKAGATPENVQAVQAVIYQAEALRDSIQIKAAKGAKTHTWLSQSEVVRLMAECATRNSGNAESEIVALRDRVAIGLLVGAGLRRLEAVNLTFDDVILQPIAGRIRTVLAVRGKGAKDRSVPISDALANLVDEWAAVVGGGGRILRSLGRNRQAGDSMSGTAMYNLIGKRGCQMGRDELQPHDLRRTYAQLGYIAGVPVAQISILLGHSNIETTMRYLNIELDLSVTVSDFVPLRGGLDK